MINELIKVITILSILYFIKQRDNNKHDLNCLYKLEEVHYKMEEMSMNSNIYETNKDTISKQ